MGYAFNDLLSDIARPFVTGVIIAGCITLFFPEDISIWASHHPFISMLVMLVVGMPMYVCATASTPIAAALILKGLNPGAALVFLLAGPATNAATMNIVRSLFSTRTLVLYLTLIAACSLVMGVALDGIYAVSGIQASAVAGQASEWIPGPIRLVSALVLALLMARGAWQAVRHSHSHR